MSKYRVSQNTPMDRNVLNYGKWTVMQPIITLKAGMHKTIDGKECYLDKAITAWEHVPGVPYFNSENEALEVIIELDKLDKQKS